MRTFTLGAALLALLPTTLLAQPPASAAEFATLDGTIAALYDVISGAAGQPRNWDRFRALFIPGARMIPTGHRPDGTHGYRVMTPEDYVTASGPILERDGFFEREIGRETAAFGNITHVFSAYEARRAPTDAAPFMRGVNSIQLINDGRRWWVASIMWDPERPDLQLPAHLLRRP